MVFLKKYNSSFSLSLVFFVSIFVIASNLVTYSFTLSYKNSYGILFAFGSSEESDNAQENDGKEMPEENHPEETSDNSEQERSNDNNDDNMDSINQNNECPEINSQSNVPTFVGQDGCQHACSDFDNKNQMNIPSACNVEPTQSTSFVPSTSPSQSEDERQSEQQKQQLSQSTNATSTSPQKTVTDSTIGSGIINSRLNTETGPASVESFNPAGPLKPGPGNTKIGDSIKSFDPTGPVSHNPADLQRKGSMITPNTNSQTPIQPENIPIKIPDKGYVTVITKVLGFYNGVQASDFQVCVDSESTTDGKEQNIPASPPCSIGSGLGFKYIVQAPGIISIGVNNLRPVSFMVKHPLSMDISAYESKTFTIYISPYPSQ